MSFNSHFPNFNRFLTTEKPSVLLYICRETDAMKLHFYKYQGTGNDFVIIDNRDLHFPKNDTRLIAALCHRRFGIGGDGLILLEHSADADFKMVYFNADGQASSMCGNGGRCIVAFAHHLGIIKGDTVFEAVDGMHKAHISGHQVELHMNDVQQVEQFEHYSFLDTGSPHHVQLVAQLEEMDVPFEGSRLRFGKYGKAGSNINFVQQLAADKFAVRTYERGVEDETYSCGTGVTAVAIAMHDLKKTEASEIHLETPGGDLRVLFEKRNETYTQVRLCGPAVLVFEGHINL